jgi:hypothetical protein
VEGGGSFEVSRSGKIPFINAATLIDSADQAAGGTCGGHDWNIARTWLKGKARIPSATALSPFGLSVSKPFPP